MRSVASRSMIQLQLIGGGRMGEALLAGLLDAGWAQAGQIRVVERLESRRAELATRFPGVDVGPEFGAASGAVVAVKPDDALDAVSDACREGVERILSIAAGVTLGRLQSAAGDGVAVIRAMPNTPALIGAGVAAVAAGSSARRDDLEWAEAILRSVGEVVAVPEHLLDAVTGLSGSGPAYVFLVAEALVEAGVLAGLPRDISEKLTHHTLLGSARLLVETDQGAEALRQAVTSPAGTTAAGLRVLEREGVRAAFIDAVIAARDRSSELGDS